MPRPKLRKLRKHTLEREETKAGRWWLRLCVAIFYPVRAAVSRVRWIGLENIPERGPVLLVANHVSHLDPIFDGVGVHQAGRVPRFLAKNTLWKVPVLGRVLKGMDQIPVYRGTTDANKSLQAAHDSLERGKLLMIYPDGTITKDVDGWPMSPKVGIATLALAHEDVTVVPVARWGTRAIYDHYRKKFRPFPRKEVVFRAGEPLDLSAYRDRPVTASLLREVSELTMSRVRDLLGEVRQETPPTEFYSPSRKAIRKDDA